MTAGLKESQDSIRRHSKSFSLASRFLPSPARDHAIAVYAWCRRADDAVDLAPDALQAGAVERLEEELAGVYEGQGGEDAILLAFRDTVESCEIPAEYPRELLVGLSMDVEGRSYDSLADLLEYCHKVAGVVGLMMCHVMGVRSEQALRNAAHLGLAMQLTNICRDVHEDWERGRLYLPERRLAAHGFPSLREHLGGPLPGTAGSAIAGAVGELLVQAESLYASGDKGVPALDWRSALSVRTARRVYSAIGDRVRAAGCDPFAGRAFVRRSQKLALVLGALVDTLAEVPDRARNRAEPRAPRRTLRYPDDILPLDAVA